jgi:hypothetical protein
MLAAAAHQHATATAAAGSSDHYHALCICIPARAAGRIPAGYALRLLAVPTIYPASTRSCITSHPLFGTFMTTLLLPVPTPCCYCLLH